MQPVDRKKFFDGYRNAFGSLEQGQVDGLELLLGFLENDEDMADIRWCAYALATVKHETANTFQPIEEYGKGKGKDYGKPTKSGRVYFGRGYVQLTWERNYLVMGPYVGTDLVSHPERTLDPEVAYRIMSVGMRKGMFTGKRLAQYINSGTCNYILARKIINSCDKAKLIAGYAEKFEDILRAAA